MVLKQLLRPARSHQIISERPGSTRGVEQWHSVARLGPLLCDGMRRRFLDFGTHYFVFRILNIGFQITWLPMRQWMTAVINFVARVKSFAIWHNHFLRDGSEPLYSFMPRFFVSARRRTCGWSRVGRRWAILALSPRRRYLGFGVQQDRGECATRLRLACRRIATSRQGNALPSGQVELDAHRIGMTWR
jgi:hypothetical protein